MWEGTYRSLLAESMEMAGLLEKEKECIAFDKIGVKGNYRGE